MHRLYNSYPRRVRDYEKWEALFILAGAMSVLGGMGLVVAFVIWMLYPPNDLAMSLAVGYGVGCAAGFLVFAGFRVSFLYGKDGASLIERLNEIGHDHSNPDGITPDHTKLRRQTLRWAPGISLVSSIWWLSMRHWLLAAAVFSTFGFAFGYQFVGNPVVLTVLGGVFGAAASYKERHPAPPPFAKKMAPH